MIVSKKQRIRRTTKNRVRVELFPFKKNNNIADNNITDNRQPSSLSSL
jgi:hypothetical protein